MRDGHGKEDRGTEFRRDLAHARMKPLRDANPAEVARMILKRAGIAPLLPALGVALLPRPAHPETQDTAGVRTAPIHAEARAQIVSARAELRAGQMVASVGPADGVTRPVTAHATVSHRASACDAATPTSAGTSTGPAGDPPAAGGCSITIYDLP